MLKVRNPSCRLSYRVPPTVLLFPHPLRRALEIDMQKDPKTQRQNEYVFYLAAGCTEDISHQSQAC